MGSNKIFTTLGASNHTKEERQTEDFYATDPIATRLLLEVEELSDTVIDNSYGAGHLMLPILESGRKVIGFDIEDRGNNEFIEFYKCDFFGIKEIPKGMDIVCNPPYSSGLEFVQHSLDLLEEGRKLCVFLKIQFLEGKKRKQFFLNNPPKTIYVSSSRILCAKNADFARMIEGGGSAVGYAWYVWEKGYKGDTIIKWIN